ncbi:MAG: hypothetical protein QME70_10640 [Bacillota bacterium]|nr:hypothetical protein [Bacillota bacterium]
MTHTLHRQGSGDLVGDYVVLVMGAKGFTREGAAPALRRCLEVILRHDPVNWGDGRTGNAFSRSREEILAGMGDNSVIHGVFTDPETVARVLDELRELDTGMSVVVSGLFNRVHPCVRGAGLEPHTIEFSLGVHGRVEGLPSDRLVMGIQTMCGHGMVSYHLISHLAGEVAAGRLGADRAAATMAANCHCGVFNPRRAAQLISELARRGAASSRGVGASG